MVSFPYFFSQLVICQLWLCGSVKIFIFLETPFHGPPGEILNCCFFRKDSITWSACSVYCEVYATGFSRTRQCYSAPIPSLLIRFHIIVRLKMVMPDPHPFVITFFSKD